MPRSDASVCSGLKVQDKKVMKYVGYLIQLTCIVGLFFGDVLREHETLRYAICALALLQLAYDMVKGLKRK